MRVVCVYACVRVRACVCMCGCVSTCLARGGQTNGVLKEGDQISPTTLGRKWESKESKGQETRSLVEGQIPFIATTAN